MKKSDLKTGMRIRFKNGDLALVLRDCETQNYGFQEIFFIFFDHDFLIGDNYDEDLNYKYNQDYDIVEIFTTSTGFVDGRVLDENDLKSIWKRKPIREMTIEEVQNELGYKIKIVE